MKLPTPQDPGRAPVWENYVYAQVVYASLGSLPRNALAVGVVIDDTRIGLRFQLSERTGQDLIDMDEILDCLEGLLGPDVQVESSFEVLGAPVVSPHDGVLWTFVARQD